MILVKAPEAWDMNVRPDRQRRLGASVRLLREARGLSQAALASSIGVELKTIQRIEGAKVPPNLKVIWALADSLGVSAAVVLGDEPTPPKSLAGVDDLAEKVSRLQAAIDQNSREIQELADRQADGAEQIERRLDALESARPGRGRKVG